MKKFIALFFLFALLQAPLAFAQRSGNGGGGGGRDGGGNNSGNSGNASGWDRGDNGGNGGGNSGNTDGWDRNNGNGNSITSRPAPANGGRAQTYSQSSGRNYLGNANNSNGRFSRASSSPRSGYFSAPVPQKLRRIGVTRVPRPITNRSQLLSGKQLKGRARLPQQGPDGKALRASVVSRTAMNSSMVRNNMSSIARDRSFTSQINTLNSTENRVNHYYWHSYNGNPYCHYYDGWGCHWYGWYYGGSCFWTQYYWGNWWWWDPFYDRWCYWNDGWWWWNDPYHVNVVYVYNNGQYVPAGADNPNVNASDSSNGGVYRSNDGSRMVKVTGPSQDAFLYDTAVPPAFKPVYLASGVKEVRFSNTQNGRTLQVMLILNDGSFDLFDDSGNPNAGASY